MATRFKAVGVKVEFEIFQMGDLLLANQLVEEGLYLGTPLYQFVLGVKWAAPADPETMLYLRKLLPDDAAWSGFGIGRQQMPMLATAVVLGGHVRVGLEDNLYLRKGEFASNVQLVERAVSMIDMLGSAPASPPEARQILGIGP